MWIADTNFKYYTIKNIYKLYLNNMLINFNFDPKIDIRTQRAVVNIELGPLLEK